MKVLLVDSWSVRAATVFRLSFQEHAPCTVESELVTRFCVQLLLETSTHEKNPHRTNSTCLPAPVVF